jgi:hypothetical protein
VFGFHNLLCLLFDDAVGSHQAVGIDSARLAIMIFWSLRHWFAA